MSLKETRGEFLDTINRRVWTVGRELTGTDVADLVGGQIEQHRLGEPITITTNKELIAIVGVSNRRISEALSALGGDVLGYRRTAIYRQTLAPRFFKAGTPAPREAQAKGGLRAASSETRHRVAVIGSIASRENSGPPDKETLLPLFLRGLSNQDVSLITGKSAPVINGVRVSLKKVGELPARPMKKPVIIFSGTTGQRENIALIRDFFNQRMFDRDLRMWDFLGQVVNHDPMFYRSVGDKLRLEIFFLVKEGEARGETNVLEKYYEALGRRNHSWAKSQRLQDETYFSQVFQGN